MDPCRTRTGTDCGRRSPEPLGALSRGWGASRKALGSSRPAPTPPTMCGDHGGGRAAGQGAGQDPKLHPWCCLAPHPQEAPEHSGAWPLKQKGGNHWRPERPAVGRRWQPTWSLSGPARDH